MSNTLTGTDFISCEHTYSVAGVPCRDEAVQYLQSTWTTFGVYARCERHEVWPVGDYVMSVTRDEYVVISVMLA